jgi:hypothetical protein
MRNATSRKPVAIALAVTLASLAGAGAVLARPKGKDLSKLPPEVQPIHCLVGEWRGAAKIEMGGQAVDLKVSMSCKAISGDFGVLCHSTFSGIPGLGTAHETDLFGYDPGAKRYHFFAVNSLGETHDHVAELPTGPTITFAYSGLQAGKPMQEVIAMTMNEAATQLTLVNRTVVDGQLVSTMSGTVTKK